MMAAENNHYDNSISTVISKTPSLNLHYYNITIPIACCMYMVPPRVTVGVCVLGGGGGF